MARRGYPAEFRRRVVELIEGGGSNSELSKEPYVSPETIDVWRRQAMIDAGLEAGVESAEHAALAAAKNARGMAIEHNDHREGETVIHSDHGTQFTSWAFTQRAVDSGLLPSMGAVGDCYDDAMIESFWSRLQVELLDRKRRDTRVELANATFAYLEIFHNRMRRHSALGMVTPVEYELQITS